MAPRRGKKKGGLTAVQRRYLSALGKSAGRVSQEAVLRSVGLTRSAVHKWRHESEEFSAQEEAVKARFEAQQTADAALALEVELEAATSPGLGDPRLDIYIRVWRETLSRHDAWTAAGMTWREVCEATATNPAFAEAVAEVETEIQIRARDTMAKEATLTGNATAANNFLKSTDPEYGRKQAPKPAPGRDFRSRVAGVKKALAAAQAAVVKEPVH